MGLLLDRSPLPNSIKDAIREHEESGDALHVPLIKGVRGAGEWAVSLPLVTVLKNIFSTIKKSGDS